MATRHDTAAPPERGGRGPGRATAGRLRPRRRRSASGSGSPVDGSGTSAGVRTPSSRPSSCCFLAFGLFPLIYTGWASLHPVELTEPTDMEWVGLRNYTRLFDDEFFWNARSNTLTIGILSTVPQLLMALGLAHSSTTSCVARPSSGSRCSRPYATSVAAATLVFVLLFGRDYGMINWALGLVGFDPSTGRPARGRRRSPSRPSSSGGGPATTR